MAYRINYRDSQGTLRLVAIADTLVEASGLRSQVTVAVPEIADRLLITEDPLLGVTSRVIQPPKSLDATMGLRVLYLGGTISPHVNWQAAAIRAMTAEPVVIANPRRERPADNDREVLLQVAWQRRHLWKADIALFWFEGRDPDPMTLLEIGTVLGNPIPAAFGVSPDFACRTELRAYVGHLQPNRTVYDTVDSTVSAAIDLVRDGAGPPVRVPLHEDDPGRSAFCVQLAIAGLKQGEPGLDMRLNELAIEVGGAAGNRIDARVLARIYLSVDRLRIDPNDPLGWAGLFEAGDALDDY